MSEIAQRPRSRRRARSSSVLPDFAPRAHGEARPPASMRGRERSELGLARRDKMGEQGSHIFPSAQRDCLAVPWPYKVLMLADQIKELAAAKSKVAQLEAAIAHKLKTELAALPAQYGFESTADFVRAVKVASGKRRGRKPGAAKRVAKPAGRKRRKRATITDQTRASVKKMVGDGNTGGEIAKALKISLPSVHNIKKALGLVRKS